MKTKKLRRALGFALGTAMILALVPASAMAEETGRAIQLVENGSAPNIAGVCILR